MTTVIQLNPPVWFNTPKGDGYAVLMTDYGPDWNRIWTVVLEESGEVWDFQNTDVRACKNTTMHVNMINNRPQPIPGMHASALAPTTQTSVKIFTKRKRKTK